MKLTQRTVDTLDLPKGKSEAIIFDEDLPGFGLRIRAGGKRVWIFQFKLGNQHRRMTLGSATALVRLSSLVPEARASVGKRWHRLPAGKFPASQLRRSGRGRERAFTTISTAKRSRAS